MIWVTLHDGQIVFVNAVVQELLGLPRHLLQGQALRDLLEHPAEWDAAILGARQGDFAALRCEAALKAGQDNIEVHMVVVPVEGEALILVEMLPTEQQTRQEREGRLMEQALANKELIRNLAHEIKNPLGGIRGAAQLLELELPSHDLKDLREYTQVIIKAGKEHRFVVIFRGKGLEGPISSTDPNREGLKLLDAQPEDPKNAAQKKTAKLIADFYKKALPVIASHPKANGFLMRGIAHQPQIPLFEQRYSLKPAALAVYPMYKGLAQLVGMNKIEGPQTIAEQCERYIAEYDNYDFFFLHYKYTDKYGEDGNFEAKKKAIEDFDAALPILLAKKPDVLVITGDHSTPCAMKGHSWHPQPVLLHSSCSGSDKLERFTETGANSGSLGVFDAKHLLRLMQANAKMFDKFGA